MKTRTIDTTESITPMEDFEASIEEKKPEKKSSKSTGTKKQTKKTASSTKVTNSKSTINKNDTKNKNKSIEDCKTTKVNKSKSSTSKKSSDSKIENTTKNDGSHCNKEAEKLVNKKSEPKKSTKKSEKSKVDEDKAKAIEKLEEARKNIKAKDKTTAKTKDTIKKTTKVETKADIKSSVLDNGLDLLISFDTTGSMYTVLAQVRKEVAGLVSSIKKVIPNIRIAIIAHGDYCDKDNPYTIRLMDFTDEDKSIIDFVKNTASTYGGDADECYELVLNTAASLASWDSKRSKAMILIGDASPHGTNYPQNVNKLDWEVEADRLGKMGVKVFSVHALSYYRSSSKKFYETVAKKTNGVYLTLDQFSDIQNLIVATCYAEFSIEKLSEFIEVVKSNNRMTNSIARNINRLAGKELVQGVFEDYKPGKVAHRTGRYGDGSLAQADGLTPIAPGRFQVLDVTENTAIKEFVNNNGLKFTTGRGFYELTKAESVQQYKEVILQDKKTGEMFNGSQVREFLGLKPQINSAGVTEKLYANSGKGTDYRIFVQSTSVNRKLIEGTKFLYEVSDI